MLLGRVRGTYLHGILRSSKARVELLVPKGDRKRFHPILAESANATIKDPLDKFANHLQTCGLDHNRLQNMIFGKTAPR